MARGKFWKGLSAAGYILFCGACLAAGSFYGWASRSPILTAIVNPFHEVPKPVEAFNSNAQTILILGCDQEIDEHTKQVVRGRARADMILVARLDFAKKTISGVSIPRDTFADLPGYPGTHRINSYYHNAPEGQEAEVTKQAVERLIGVNVDRVVVVDYAAFIRLIDLIGGVTVDVPKQLDYDDNAGNLHIHLKPGRQKLSGYDAMCYVRYRHANSGSADTDFQRQDRQKDLLVNLKSSVLAHKERLPEIAEAARRVFGGALTNDQLLSLAFFGGQVKPDQIRLGMVPTVPKGNGLRLDREHLPQVLSEFGLIAK